MRIRKKEVVIDSLTEKEIDLVTKVSDALAHPARLPCSPCGRLSGARSGARPGTGAGAAEP